MVALPFRLPVAGANTSRRRARPSYPTFSRCPGKHFVAILNTAAAPPISWTRFWKYGTGRYSDRAIHQIQVGRQSQDRRGARHRL